MKSRILAALVLVAGLPLAPAADAPFVPVLYELAEGSALIDECLFCGRRPLVRPLRGTLVLERLPVKILGELYEIREMSLYSENSDAPAITGGGTLHRLLGDPDPQTLTLDAEVAAVATIHLVGMVDSPEGRWPAIDLTAGEDGTRDPAQVFSLRIVARPAAASPFRRGDPSGDGAVDLTDAIGVLEHLFLSGAVPACPDAADGDDSGSLDLADPIAILGALFLGGSLPPPAGACGDDPTEDGLPCPAACP